MGLGSMKQVDMRHASSELCSIIHPTIYHAKMVMYTDSIVTNLHGQDCDIYAQDCDKLLNFLVILPTGDVWPNISTLPITPQDMGRPVGSDVDGEVDGDVDGDGQVDGDVEGDGNGDVDGDVDGSATG